MPGARVKVGFGGSSEKYVLVLAGEDGRVLGEHARRVEHELRTIPGIGDVVSTASLVRPELIVRPDFARAADLGVTSAAIADTLRIATAGDYDQALAKLNLAQRQVPVVVKLAADARTDLDLLSRLAVPGARGPVHARQRRRRSRSTAVRRRSTATTACATSTSRSSSTSSRSARSRSRRWRCRACRTCRPASMQTRSATPR